MGWRQFSTVSLQHHRRSRGQLTLRPSLKILGGGALPLGGAIVAGDVELGCQRPGSRHTLSTYEPESREL